MVINKTLFQRNLEMRRQSRGAKMIWMDSVIPVEYLLFPEGVNVVFKSDSSRATVVF